MWSKAGQSLRGWGADLELPKPFGDQRIMGESQMSDTEVYTVGLLFCFDLIVTVLWLFPLGKRKYFTYFDFIEHTVMRL